MSKQPPYEDDSKNNKRTFRPGDDASSAKDSGSSVHSEQENSRVTAYDVDEHPFELRHEVKRLNQRLDKIANSLEKSEFLDMLQNYSNPKKRIMSNLTAGIARGLGLSIGTIVILALLAWLLSFLVTLNLPVIGDFIAELLNYVKLSQG